MYKYQPTIVAVAYDGVASDDHPPGRDGGHHDGLLDSTGALEARRADDVVLPNVSQEQLGNDAQSHSVDL